MKLYLLAQSVNRGYDSYDSMVVCSDTPQEALRTSPCNGDYMQWNEEIRRWQFVYGDGRRETKNHYSWVDNLNDIKWTEIGKAEPFMKKGVVCASFNAG